MMVAMTPTVPALIVRTLLLAHTGGARTAGAGLDRAHIAVARTAQHAMLAECLMEHTLVELDAPVEPHWMVHAQHLAHALVELYTLLVLHLMVHAPLKHVLLEHMQV